MDTKTLLGIVSIIIIVVVMNFSGSSNTDESGAPTVSPKGLVSDEAGILSSTQRQQIAQYHAAVLKSYDIDFRVGTTKRSNNLDKFAAKRFRKMGVGGKSKTGRGLLLVIDSKENLVRMEVGRSLEGVYTDAFVKYIQQRQMVPFFRANRVADGILATTELIAGRANEAFQGKAFDAASVKKVEPSTGAGARSNAEIGAGYNADEGQNDQRRAQVRDSANPISVLNAYMVTLRDGMKNRDPAIYSQGSIAFFKGRVSTGAQARREFDSLSKCQKREGFAQGSYAVVRHAIGQRECPPYLFVKEGSAWKLHFPDMAKYIRFNHQNEWHFESGVPSSYAFAFTDWKFDGHHFPIGTKQ